MTTPQIDPHTNLRTQPWQRYLTPAETTDVLGRLRHYEVQRVLGEGGYGIVFCARDVMLNRAVAIKMLSPALANSIEDKLRFLREGRAAAAVRHANVVQIYAVEEEPIPYLVMEYIAGTTLETLMERVGPMPLQLVLELGLQVAVGLTAAHERGLVHRDIKPANILVEQTPEQRALVTDFGLALVGDNLKLTQSGMIAGTPMYMSPEQAHGETLDARSDVFSFGTLLDEMIAGQPAFAAPTAMAVLKQICDTAPRPLAEVAPQTPPWLCQLVSELHIKRRDARTRTMRAVADELAQQLAQLGKHLPPARAALAPTTITVSARGPQSRWFRLLLTVSAGLIGLFAVLWFGPARPAPTPPEPPIATPAPLSPKWENRFGMQFVRIPKGSSWLGGTAGRPGQQRFTTSADFYLGTYEVTQGNWERVLGNAANPSRHSRNSEKPELRALMATLKSEELQQMPVDAVSWQQCQMFLGALNALAAEPGWEYRLPTLAEWEYACRGGPLTDPADAGFDFYLARPTLHLTADDANINYAFLRRPRRVGQYAPNRLGLYDLHGNVFEFCHETKKNDQGEEEAAFRGGAFHEGPEFCRAERHGYIPVHWNYDGAGLRVARVPK